MLRTSSWQRQVQLYECAPWALHLQQLLAEMHLHHAAIALHLVHCESHHAAIALHTICLLQCSIDGAYFGTTFPHLLLMSYPMYRPPKSTDRYVPRVFGFKLHPSAYQNRDQAQQRALPAPAAGQQQPRQQGNGAAAAAAGDNPGTSSRQQQQQQQQQQ